MAGHVAEQNSSFLQSTYPVVFPFHAAFSLPEEQFREFLKHDLVERQPTDTTVNPEQQADDHDDSITLISAPSTIGILGQDLAQLDVQSVGTNTVMVDTEPAEFEDAVGGPLEDTTPDLENKMLTQNADVAYRSTTNALVDLFAELEDVISGPRLRELLAAAWKEDSLATLKIIFNARSIHIGKGSRSVFYRCAGWLAHEHPLTLLLNLEWLSRPVIKKSVEEKDEVDASDPQVKDSVAHGYYKDLLNILVLAVNDKFDELTDPRSILDPRNQNKEKRGKVWDADQAKARRHKIRSNRHDIATKKFTEDAFYRSLHLTITRLFANQLAADLALLRSADKGARQNISLCAKWAPSHKLFHDKHTYIVSSIAEMLHPQKEFEGVSDRQSYLLHAREVYRKEVATLRQALEIVERDITAKTFSNIKYNRVPSLAMSKYAGLFARKDLDRFDKYIEGVASGKQKISGAVLFPSKLIHSVRKQTPEHPQFMNSTSVGKSTSVKSLLNQKMDDLNAKVVDGQWKTLVQRIRDSGTLSSSIAVCDVSGSMNYPSFPDGTTPMDTAIGLSLLVAEVTAPPFGGKFITFSAQPTYQHIDLTDTLQAKVRKMESSAWQMNTDFVAVFEKLLLPEAIRQKVKPEDMVKRVFVFSDMQFDSAQFYKDPWSTSYERIVEAFAKHQYEMPQLVFWNLAGGRAGYAGTDGDPTAPKPVTAHQDGAALVTGYSQGLLKVFMDNGQFEEPEEAVDAEIVDDDVAGEEETILVQKNKKVKMDPLITVKKAISHEGYAMLVVVD